MDLVSFDQAKYFSFGNPGQYGCGFWGDHLGHFFAVRAICFEPLFRLCQSDPLVDLDHDAVMFISHREHDR
jgi:hypothetical protein